MIYITVKFLKLFFVILISLLLFFLTIDSLQYSHLMPNSKNLVILFFLYNGMYALNYVLPISLLLSVIVFYTGFVRNNQYIVFLALGYSKKKILAPILTIILIFTFIFVGLNSTSFVYAQDNALNIINGNNNSNSENIFIKYNSDYILIKKIYPLLKKAQEIEIYSTKNKDSKKILTRIIKANEGYFIDDEWVLKNAEITILPQKDNENKIFKEEVNDLKILKGFKPRVLDTIYQNKPSVSITDALISFQILWREDSNTARVRSLLYNLILIPFFVPLMTLVVVFFFPINLRYGNLTSRAIALSLVSMIFWGIFFSLGKLSANNIFIPEIGLLFPMMTFFIVTLFFYKKF